jgi:hypothetical protein
MSASYLTTQYSFPTYGELMFGAACGVAAGLCVGLWLRNYLERYSWEREHGRMLRQYFRNIYNYKPRS